MEKTLDILIERFGYDAPILACDLEETFPDVPRRTIYSRLNRLIESGAIERYETGVYYIASTTILGKTPLNPLKVIERKYLRDPEGGVCGFWSGATLDNSEGISEQVPMRYEVVTNNASCAQREVTVGGYVKCVVHKSRVDVDRDNVDSLRFLDVLTRRKPKELTDGQRDAVKRLAEGLSKDDLLALSMAYPQKTTRRLVESEMLGVFA
ncbi:hypothetical protein [Adlercreutzia sp. ZJ141]|uniref:hypothetical protein n=1 Tax=Adlercreutzia sp. ZJ141 TaxID=2709406 RepID=UPI0013ED51E7|nr:hypothetical protein [Adlercreutzia sp. ZJ141]